MIIGIGIDLVKVERIEKLLQRPVGAIKEIFTAEEIEYCNKKKFSADRPTAPIYRGGWESYAARFAAKEAFLKAIGTGWGTAKSPAWNEIEIIKKDNSFPTIKLSGKAERIARQLGATKIRLSLTHTKEYAMAVVILEGN